MARVSCRALGRGSQAAQLAGAEVADDQNASSVRAGSEMYVDLIRAELGTALANSGKV